MRDTGGVPARGRDWELADVGPKKAGGVMSCLLLPGKLIQRLTEYTVEASTFPEQSVKPGSGQTFAKAVTGRAMALVTFA